MNKLLGYFVPRVKMVFGRSMAALTTAVYVNQVNQPLTPQFWIELIRTILQLRTAGYNLVRRERALLFVLHPS